VEANHDNKESVNKTKSVTEDAEKLIAKKQAERADEGMRIVQESAQGVQSEVADVMGGMEAAKETVSERKGESGEKGDIKASGGGQAQDDDDGTYVTASGIRRVIPTEEIMIKKIRAAINIQIKQEMKRALQLQKTISSGGAHEYNNSIAKIRRLKEVLASLATSAYEAIKGLYLKYFGINGKQDQ
jgi:hypothetical protein